MKKSLFRTSLVIALILALVGLTVSSFAYWDRLTTKEENNEVILGEGAELQVVKKVVVDGKDGKLIPANTILGVDDVYEVKFEFDVKLSKEAQQDLNLTVTASNVKIGGDATHEDLVNIDITGNFLVNLAGTKITVTVTLNEPVDQAAYEAIFNQTITFDLTFQGSAQV